MNDFLIYINIRYIQNTDNKGSSPVIGVILLVSLVVALTVLAYFIIFGITDGISDRPDISIDTETQDDQLSITILRNKNVENLKIKQNDTVIDTISKIDSGVTKKYNNLSDGTVKLIAVGKDSEELVKNVYIETSNTDEVNYFSGFGSDDKFKGGEIIFDMTNDYNSQIEITEFSIDMDFNKNLDNSDSDEVRIRKVNQDGLAKRDTEYLTDGTRYELDVRAIINDNETGEFEFKGFSNTSFDLEYANNKSDADATLKLFFDSGNKQTFYLKQRK